MSQAGGDATSIKEALSRPGLLRRGSSAWNDFQSIVSEHAIAEDEPETDKSPGERSNRALKFPNQKSPVQTPSPAQDEQVFKKWQGFTRDLQQAIDPQGSSNQKRRMPQTIHEGEHKSISLMGDPNVDSVISKVQVFKGGISDVLPVTDFQSLAITGTLLESRWMLNYFYLDGGGPLDIRRLKQTAFRMVQAFDILRTVFVPYGDRFLQVVLRKLQPDFTFHETIWILTTSRQSFDKKIESMGLNLAKLSSSSSSPNRRRPNSTASLCDFLMPSMMVSVYQRFSAHYRLDTMVFQFLRHPALVTTSENPQKPFPALTITGAKCFEDPK
jgi:hypothetical protein